MKLLTKLRCRLAMRIMPKQTFVCSDEWTHPAPFGMVVHVTFVNGGSGEALLDQPITIA